MRGKDMKMKNLVKTFVLAFGTLASALAVEAGDIFSIEPVSGSCEPASALKSGQKLQFMMRLLARDWEADAPGAWEEVFSSECVCYGGDGRTGGVRRTAQSADGKHRLTIPIPAHSVQFFEPVSG